MKIQKFKLVITSGIFLLCSVFCLAFSLSATPALNFAVAQSATVTNTSALEESKSHSYTNSTTGTIPFSLFTTTPSATTGEFLITDYKPTFTTRTGTQNKIYYSMNTNTMPYIVLSSTRPDEFYNKTLFFKFNDQTGVTASNPAKISAINVQGAVRTANSINEIFLSCEPTGVSNNQQYSFAVNLLPLVNTNGQSNPDAECPFTQDGTKLGGNTNNNVSYRTGLYSFTIEYVFEKNGQISGSCIYEISFYIIDYGAYVNESTNPLQFLNTNTYQYTDQATSTTYPTDYELYNYNFDSAPVVRYDASKFGLNYTFTSGTNIYNFSYSSFAYDNTQGRTGRVTINTKIGNVTYPYTFYCYNENDIYYNAYFDLADFQDKVINPNATAFKTNSFQGIYSFNLDILIPTTSSENFTAIPTATLDASIGDILNCKRMAIFGYELKYTDSLTQNRLPLVKYDGSGNLITKTSVIATNEQSADYYVSIPDKIAITNQKNLRFDNFGNLSSSSYTAKYLHITSGYTGDAVMNGEDYFGSIKNSTPETLAGNISTLSAEIETNGTLYTQGSQITVDGIYIMKLEYTISFILHFSHPDTGTIDIPKNVMGTQYIVFEVNNNIQKLKIQSINTGANYLYDFNTYTNQSVLVSLEEMPNSFFIPTVVSYTRSTNFNGTVTYSGTLNLKPNTRISVGGKNYNYYVLNSANNFTFNQDGLYTVSIRIATTSTASSETYTFYIDSDTNKLGTTGSITNAQKLSLNATSITNAQAQNGKYYKTSALVAKETGSDLYLTSQPFSLSWKPSESGSLESCYVSYMKQVETSNDVSMFKESTYTYWLTNKYQFSPILHNVMNNGYINSYGVTTGNELSNKSYFKEDGIYFFFVYDLAGNYFSLTVILDTSSSSILQGRWSGDSENSAWVNTYDKTNNQANYVNSDTLLYFGTHKALLLPNISIGSQITITDPSYTTCYNLANGATVPKTNFTPNFYSALLNMTNYVSSNSTTDLLDFNGSVSTNYYFLLRNDSLSETTTSRVFNLARDIYRSAIYNINSNDVPFKGENNYTFNVTGQTGIVTQRKINMNFDLVQGTFYAYNNPVDTHIITQNSGTNLSMLKFTYTKNSSAANYYDIVSLYYEYYGYSFSSTDPNYSPSSYPYSNVVTLRSDLTASADADGIHYSTDAINVTYDSGLGLSGVTKPGKYVITRVYRGGTHSRVSNGDGTFSYVLETGGNYYFSEGQYFPLFNIDSKTRSYTIYVDHNSIIDASVGENISVTLGNDNTATNQWTFKDFYKASLTSTPLITNRVPVKLNIPYSKYFLYTSPVSFVFSNLNFAKLNVKIYYSSGSANITYTSNTNTYNLSTGMLTCSSLASSNNPNGDFIFSNEGTYIVVITDNTGITPTSYTFEFTITYSSPEISVYTHSYARNNNNEWQFIDTPLEDQTSQKTFATNIKEKNNNINLDDNKILLKWDDSSTPYLANIDKITISVQNPDNTTSSYVIVLSTLDKANIISSLGGIINSNFGSYTNPTQNRFVLLFTISYYNSTSPYETFDGKNYYRYSYEMSLSISREVTYTVTVSYISADGETYVRGDNTSFADSVYTVKIDRTKPNTNIDRLISSESLLSQYFTNTNDFKEENFDYSVGTLLKPTSLTYAFGVTNSYSLTYNANETLSYFYVRNYQKYNGDYSSITPDMIDSVYPSSHAYYGNQQYFGGYPRFMDIRVINGTITLSNQTYYQINYISNTSLYNLIKANLGVESPSGYYEIIEKDLAGNYRTFTVYFPNFTNTYELINITGEHENGETLRSGNAITATNYFILKSLSSKLGWGTITLKNERLNTTFSTVIEIRPNIVLLPDLLSRINAFFSSHNNSRRYSLTLSRYNSAYPQSTIYVNIITESDSVSLASPVIQENSTPTGTSYTLVLPTSTATTYLYLESFKLYVFQNNSWQATNHNYTLNVPKNITGLNKGIYKAEYKDNYNISSYFFIVYVGEFYLNDFSKEVTFDLGSYAKDNSNGIYYSGGDVNITYEGNIYEVWVNGVKFSGSAFESISSKYSSYNCKNFNLTSNFGYANILADSSVGGSTSYEVVYRDITDKSVRKTLRFTIFDYLPGIILTNENDQDTRITSTLQESSSQITNAIVNIDYGVISGCAFSNLNDSGTSIVSEAKLYMRDENGEYSNSKIVPRGTVVDEEGYYRLDITNKLLGNTRSIYFVIQFGEFPLYTVYSSGNQIYHSSHETFNLCAPNSTAKFNGTDTFDEIIDILYSALGNLKLSGKLTKIVDTRQQKTEYDILVGNLGYRSGDSIFNSNYIGVANVLNVPHFYSVSSPSVIYNSNIKLNIIEFVFKDNVLMNYYLSSEGTNPTPANVERNYWTTIYLVYNLSGPIRIELFAVTKVPTNSSLVTSKITYKSSEQVSSAEIDLTSSTTNLEKILTNADITNNQAIISFNMLPLAEDSRWFKQGNFVYMMECVGLDEEYSALDFTTNAVLRQNSSVISGSGTHRIMFRDIAGNTHQFTTSSQVAEKNVYKIILLDQVIYYLTIGERSQNPIQYGVFNGAVSLTLDPEYLSRLSNLIIRVTLNGSSTTNFSQNGNVYTFSSAGKYVVKLDAKYNGRDLKTATYNFTIINENASRLSFEYPSISGYRITRIIKDSRNITSSVVATDGSMFINASDTSSGSGFYTVTLQYGKNASDTLTFSFMISDYSPTISSNIAYGETSTSNIVLSYNPNYIYNQIGECYINILVWDENSDAFYTYRTVAITSDALSSSGAATITMTESYSYFVQVKTMSGNVVSSFRVNKVDPLNVFAIIAIIIASVAAIVLLIVVIKLRTRMKVR